MVGWMVRNIISRETNLVIKKTSYGIIYLGLSSSV